MRVICPQIIEYSNIPFMTHEVSFSLMSFNVLGPPITSTSEQKASVLISKQNGSDLANGPFIMMTPTVSTYSQQLWVIAKVTTDNKDGERIYYLDQHLILHSISIWER
jgi:hypothetical protein